MTPGNDNSPKPSFLFNIRVARDSFFDPLHEDYQHMDQLGNYSVLTPDCQVEGRSKKTHKDSLVENTPGSVATSSESNQNSPVPSPYSPPRPRQSTARAKIRSFFKKLIGSGGDELASLEGEDQGLAELQSHIWR